MPVVFAGEKRVDYLEEGEGETVLLIHSSVSGNRQWRAFIDMLKGGYRVIAPNLFGYGESTPWSGSVPQTLTAQAEAVLALCAQGASPVHVVGHSYGGAVALKVASLLGERAAGKLVLFEPMLPYLLRQNGRHDAYAETVAIADHVCSFGVTGDWTTAAARFADYWLGEGAWEGMPEKRRNAFLEAIRPAVHEFEAVMGELSTAQQYRMLSARTMVMYDTRTRRPILEIVDILEKACPHWTFKRICGPGHMAPLTHPELINPMIRAFLEME